jgi:hypothetical protein
LVGGGVASDVQFHAPILPPAPNGAMVMPATEGWQRFGCMTTNQAAGTVPASVDARAAASALVTAFSSSSRCGPGWTVPGWDGPLPVFWPRSKHLHPKERNMKRPRPNRHRPVRRP